jgi:hypothetical protein
MANQRTTFLKRQREADRNDKQKAKAARLAAARSETKTTKGPQIAWDEQVTETDSSLDNPATPVTGGNLSSPTAASNNTASAPKPASKPAPAPAPKPAPAPTATPAATSKPKPR